MMVEVDIKIEEIAQYIRGLRPKVNDGYDVLWQALVTSWQFKDLQKSIAYYLRFKDNAYLAEAKTHLADLITQFVAMCITLDLDIKEIIDMGYNRIKEHASIEIYPRLWEHE